MAKDLATSIAKRARGILFRAAWRRGQKIRQKAERLSQYFFRELVTVGVDAAGPPRLGKFTPEWLELSDDWIERKGHSNFYYASGALERALLNKSTQGVFGRPKATLEFNGQRMQVTAAAPPKKYADAKGPFKLILEPFPKVKDANHVERVVAAEGTKTFYKLVNPNGHTFRPLISPFFQWYTHVKMKQAFVQ